MVAHRRAGKTVACVNELNKAAITATIKDARFAYIAPLYVQAKDIAWTYLKRYALPIPGVVVNESELRIDYPNGARVRLYGADNADRLRGGYLDGVILDEYADMHPAAWGEVIRPMLADRKGWAVFIGTPKGRNDFHRMWDRALKEPNWFTLMLKASESGLLDADELKEARAEMTAEQFAQEFECSFDAAIMGAYYGSEIADAERDGRITEVAYDPSLPVHVVFDLGMDDPTAIWVFQLGPEGIRVIDCYENNGQQISHYVNEMEARGYKGATYWLPHDAKVRSLETGRTRVETFHALGCNCKMTPNEGVMDGINAVRVSFKRFWFDKDKCKFGIEALRQYHADYDEKLKVFKKSPRHDWTSHFADSFRYLALAWREVAPAVEKIKRPEELGFEVNPITRSIQSNMNVREIVEMKERLAKIGRKKGLQL